MPVRIATVPFDDVGSLKTLLSAESSTIEDGFHILETDLTTSDAGTIDLLGVDRNGALTLVALASGGPDGALLRLLDQYRWALAERHLLVRAYPSADPETRRTVRCLLIAPSFTHRFLERLALLKVAITPCLLRRLESRLEVSLLVEPAAAIFGAGEAAPPAPPETRSLSNDVEVEPASQVTGPADESVVPEIDLDGVLDEMPPPGGIELEALPVEPLTPEELEEFEHFDLQRRAGDRRRG